MLVLAWYRYRYQNWYSPTILQYNHHYAILGLAIIAITSIVNIAYPVYFRISLYISVYHRILPHMRLTCWYFWQEEDVTINRTRKGVHLMYNMSLWWCWQLQLSQYYCYTIIVNANITIVISLLPALRHFRKPSLYHLLQAQNVTYKWLVGIKIGTTHIIWSNYEHKTSKYFDINLLML